MRSAPPLALVTGASGGLGEALARRLATDGYRVIVTARRRELLERLAGELPTEVSIVAADLTEPDPPAALRAAVDEAGGQLDLLVANAGIGGRGRFADEGHAGIARTMALNFDAQVRVTEALLPSLRAARGSAIYVGSVSGRIARPGAGAYSAAKAALHAWADALRAEEAEHGVHVGLVVPGFIATEGFPQTELLAKRRTRWLVGRPEHVCDAVADLVRTRQPERHAPAPWRLASVLGVSLPRVRARLVAGGGLTPTANDD